MAHSAALLISGLSLVLLSGCIISPEDYYGLEGRPVPPPVPPPPPSPYYYGEEPGDPYFGRRHAHRDRDFEPDPYRYPRRHGGTQYLPEEEPVADQPVGEPGSSPRSGIVADTDSSARPAPPVDETGSTSPGTGTGTTPAPKIDPSTVPVATTTSTPGRVKSPYPPYRELDVAGMRSGSLAKDPTTGKVFKVP